MFSSFLVPQMVRICLQCRRPGFNPWVWKISWRRKWLPTPISLLGEFHGQRRLVGYSPWGHKELDTTELLTLSPSLFTREPWLKRNEPRFCLCSGTTGLGLGFGGEWVQTRDCTEDPQASCGAPLDSRVASCKRTALQPEILKIFNPNSYKSKCEAEITFTYPDPLF